ncbi:hypothetical protein F5879DRAFT_923901 [Lentinula edodes]|nr:hypothetical protein F5879DRAFT_923901 [Lentinula edodes]
MIILCGLSSNETKGFDYFNFTSVATRSIMNHEKVAQHQAFQDWVEVLADDVIEEGHSQSDDKTEGPESELHDEDDDTSLDTLTLIEKQQQWIDVGRYIIQKLRRRLRRNVTVNKQLIQENRRLRRELAALKRTVAQ